MIGYYLTAPQALSSLTIDNVTPGNRLSGTEDQDLTVLCNVEGGTPAPNVRLIIDGQTVANQASQYNIH
jgi:hypothetical protein